MSDRLAGKVAVITGAASGLGEGTVRRFVEEGARVIVADIQREAGQAVASSLGDAAMFIRTDVTVEADVAAAVELAVATWGRLDVMFNNAGIVGAVGSLLETSDSDWRATLAILLDSVFYGTKHAGRAMRTTGGSIINTSSAAGVMGGLGPHAYTTAKHAVIGLTKSSAAELSVYGIRVNAIAPGSVMSALTAEVITGDQTDTAGAAASLAASNPLGFTPEPIDIANAALYLASDEARFVSGHTLVVDGGRTTNGGSRRFAEREAGIMSAVKGQ